MNHDPWRDRLEEYALGSIHPDEREQIEQHLEECPDCRQELARIEHQLSQLPEALVLASGATPPDAVKERLLQTIKSHVADTPRRRVRLPVRSGYVSWTPARVAAIVMLVALAISVGWGFRLNQALSEERELRERIADLVGQQEIVLEIVDGGDTVRRVLRPPADSDSDSYGKVFTRPAFTEVVIMAARLPDAPEGSAYHVWLTSDERRWLAGTLKVNDEGFGLLVVEASEPGPEFSSTLISLQPRGTSDPGSTTVLTWEEE